MLTVSRLILTLQSYWDAHGCALLQPYDVEVGAGTSHPATLLRAIGHEPWRAPDDIQACYQDSLRALGLDLTQNDVRFVEDDWENPTLGAWGLGWEVWL